MMAEEFPLKGNYENVVESDTQGHRKKTGRVERIRREMIIF